MSKSFKIGTIFFSLVLVVLIVNMSFAWYAAKVNQGKIEDLTSEAIEITFNSSENSLKPDILKEGVLTIVDGEYVYPSEDIYYESRKTVVTVKEDVVVYLAESTGVNLTFNLSYKGKNGLAYTLTLDELVKYFEIKYALVEASIVDPTLNVYSGSTDITLDKSVSSYTLYLEISYNLPDELLPSDLVSSEEILLVVSGSLV